MIILISITRGTKPNNFDDSARESFQHASKLNYKEEHTAENFLKILKQSLLILFHKVRLHLYAL